MLCTLSGTDTVLEMSVSKTCPLSLRAGWTNWISTKIVAATNAVFFKRAFIIFT
jgi:hypothetical protein